MDSKPTWQSKAIWANLIIAVAAFFPEVQKLIVEEPTIMIALFAGVNIILRYVSKGSITIK